MIKKRVVGVVTVKGGWAVQSMGYRRWLPLGKPEVLVENLDRWGADEIILQCIDRAPGAGPELSLLERVSRKGLSTPLIYAGGIYDATQAVAAIKCGADRICIDALLHDAPHTVKVLSGSLGAQALIASLPLSCAPEGLMWLDHRSGRDRPLDGEILKLLGSGLVSEALIIDWQHEGTPSSFDLGLLERFPIETMPLIAFGGLSEPRQVRGVLQREHVAAAAIGNFLNYREHAIHHFKAHLGGLPVRLSTP